ncbi:MAG: DUF998 domain-containing protein [Acidimicrobiales bacterium]
MTRTLAVGGVVGPAAFVSAWSLLGTGQPGYFPTRDAISRLAAVGAPTRPLMTAGFVALGIGAPLYGLALRSARPGPAWVAAVGTGLSTLGAAAFPLGSGSHVVDTLHGLFAGAGYLSLAALPLLAAGGAGGSGRALVASRATGALAAASLAASLLGPDPGLFQRIGLTLGHLWMAVSAAEILASDRLQR